MKTIKTANYFKLSKNKYPREDNFKDIKKPKDNRMQWNSDDDFSSRMKDEFSGEADKKKDDKYKDKWELLLNKHKKPALAKSNKIIIEAKKK